MKIVRKTKANEAAGHGAHESQMGIATVGAKGQIVIPADIRAALGLKEGERLILVSKGRADDGHFMAMRPHNVERFVEKLSANLSALKHGSGKKK